ncbi:hypothetical protein CS8_063260 [Cupriavidus sp. 8B]
MPPLITIGARPSLSMTSPNGAKAATVSGSTCKRTSGWDGGGGWIAVSSGADTFFLFVMGNEWPGMAVGQSVDIRLRFNW